MRTDLSLVAWIGGLPAYASSPRKTNAKTGQIKVMIKNCRIDVLPVHATGADGTKDR